MRDKYPVQVACYFSSPNERGSAEKTAFVLFHDRCSHGDSVDVSWSHTSGTESVCASPLQFIG